jgi:putative transposase
VLQAGEPVQRSGSASRHVRVASRRELGNLSKTGFPKFKKNCRSVEYKTSGWKLSQTRKTITFSDKKGIGTLKLKGTYDLNYYDIKQIKRVRLLRRADGYYAQFAIDVNIKKEIQPSGQVVGIDLGLKYFIADNKGNVEQSPQFYRKSEKQLNRANRKKSKKFSKEKKKSKQRQSNNYHKARNRYARKHLRVSRQRKEYCKRVAYSVIQSNDLVAYEDLNVKGLVRNRLVNLPRMVRIFWQQVWEGNSCCSSSQHKPKLF